MQKPREDPGLLYVQHAAWGSDQSEAVVQLDPADHGLIGKSADLAGIALPVEGRLAEIDEQCFQRDRPVAGPHVLHAAADNPAEARLARRFVPVVPGGIRVEEGILDAANGETA